MQVEIQQECGGYPVYCTECYMYDYLSAGQKLWVCARYNECLIFCSFEAKGREVGG